jgi:hypothetical protein
MPTIFDVLKIIAALVVIAATGYYWDTTRIRTKMGHLLTVVLSSAVAASFASSRTLRLAGHIDEKRPRSSSL